MKAVQAISGAFLVIGGAILGIIVSSAYGRKYAVLKLTQDFWLPIILLVMMLSAAALFLSLRASAKKSGRKGGFSAFMAILFAAGAAYFAYCTADRIRSRETYRFAEIRSPDGLHSVWRTERSDVLGNSCYVYYRQENPVTYTYLFDSDKGTVPQINWQAAGLEYQGQFFSYSD